MLPVEGVGRVVCPAYLGGGERDCATVVEKQSLRHQHVSVALGGHKKKWAIGLFGSTACSNFSS